MTMSRYAYDYSLSPARPTGWRATFASITVVGTVMAISAISGALVTLQLFASPAQDAPRPRVAAAFSVVPAPQPVAPDVVALAVQTASVPAPAVAASEHVAPPVTTAAVPAAQPVPLPPVATAAIQPAPVAAQPAPAPIADSELTFAKGYAQRQAVANGTTAARQAKILVAAKTQLGRAALKAKPKTYARNNADRRRIETARGDAYGMFQRFERPDQFEFARHQTLAFGEQRTTRRRNDAPRQSGPGGNAPNGLFGGLF